MPCLASSLVNIMTETNSKNYGAENAQSDIKVGRKSSLRSKLKSIRDKADIEIAQLKSENVPVKREIRSKIYDVNRRIKAIYQSIDQNEKKIDELKSGLLSSAVPVKHAVKLVKIENTMLNNQIAVYSDVVTDYTTEIAAIDAAISEKIATVQTKTEKTIETERLRHIERRKKRLDKQREKHKLEVEAKRQAKVNEEQQERLKSQLRLRQYVNFKHSPVIVSTNNLPEDAYIPILSSFNLVTDKARVENVLSNKLDQKYFSMIRKGMAKTLTVSPTDILLISIIKNAENDQKFKISFHLNKDRKIENLVAQFGFARNIETGNMDFEIDTTASNYSDLLSDLEVLFSDLSKLIKVIVDVELNALLQH